MEIQELRTEIRRITSGNMDHVGPPFVRLVVALLDALDLEDKPRELSKFAVGDRVTYLRGEPRKYLGTITEVLTHGIRVHWDKDPERIAYPYYAIEIGKV